MAYTYWFLMESKSSGIVFLIRIDVTLHLTSPTTLMSSSHRSPPPEAALSSSPRSVRIDTDAANWGFRSGSGHSDDARHSPSAMKRSVVLDDVEALERQRRMDADSAMQLCKLIQRSIFALLISLISTRQLVRVVLVQSRASVPRYRLDTPTTLISTLIRSLTRTRIHIKQGRLVWSTRGSCRCFPRTKKRRSSGPKAQCTIPTAKAASLAALTNTVIRTHTT